MLLLLQSGLYIALLLAASLWDLRKRIIPDSLCLSIALTGLLTFEPVRLFGILAAVPLFLPALFLGGMGGGDIKLMAAAGVMLGFQKSMAAMILGLTALLVFHAIYLLTQKWCVRGTKQAYPLAPFLSLGCLAAYLFI